MHADLAMLHEADLIKRQTETEAYMQIAGERYRLLRTHDWNDEVLARVVQGRSRRSRKPKR